MIFLLFMVMSMSGAMAQAPALSPPPVSENPPIEIPLGKVPYSKNKKKIKGPVILDARPFFKFSMNHIQDSQPIRIEDYSQTDDPFKGLIEPDPQVISRKLGALGISPESEVIVLGEGVKGRGEEGRIVWLLKYMGIKNVKVATYDSYILKNKNQRGSQNWYQTQASKIWLPKVDAKWRIRKKELKEDLSKFSIIDCSTQEDFEKGHVPGAIRISWKDFLETKDLKKLLIDNKVEIQKEIVFYGNSHVGCGYAVFLINDVGLTGVGFARHYDGAYDDWKNN